MESRHSFQFFDRPNFIEAMESILLPIGSHSGSILTTEDRWRIETEYLMKLIDTNWSINPDSIILDYGCGVGRISRALIEKYNCKVIGVDAVPSMREYAVEYVNSECFSIRHPFELKNMVGTCDYALSIWVYLHVYCPEFDIDLTKNAMKEDGKLLVVSDKKRCVPTENDVFLDDGIDLMALLEEKFKLTKLEALEYFNFKIFQDSTFVGWYER